MVPALSPAPHASASPHLVGRGGCSRGIPPAVGEFSWFLGAGAQQTGHCCEADKNATAPS